MTEIQLTQGHVTIVDDFLSEDIQWIKFVKWHAHRSRSGIYARRKKSVNGKQVSQFLHRVLARTPKHLQTDHVNGDRLDNRLCNLRNVKQSTNIRNCWKRKKCRQKQSQSMERLSHLKSGHAQTVAESNSGCSLILNTEQHASTAKTTAVRE